MHPTVENTAARRAGLISAVAFWAAAVMFVADLSVLSGWVFAASAWTAPVATPATDPATAPVPTAPTVPPAGLVAQQFGTGARVLFPGNAQRSEQLIDVGGTPTTVVLYSITTAAGAHFSVGVIKYPPQTDLSDPAVNLLGSVSGASGTVGGRIVSKTSVLVGGAPAITYQIEARSVSLRGRNVLDGRHLYTQSVAYQGAIPPHTRGFFGSFRLPRNS